MTYVKTCLSNVLSGSCPVTRSGSPFAEKVDLEPFCLPKGGFEYIESSNNQKQRLRFSIVSLENTQFPRLL